MREFLLVVIGIVLVITSPMGVRYLRKDTINQIILLEWFLVAFLIFAPPTGLVLGFAWDGEFDLITLFAYPVWIVVWGFFIKSRVLPRIYKLTQNRLARYHW